MSLDRYEQTDRNAAVDRRVLEAIRRGLSEQREIADHLGFYNGTVYFALQRLVRAGRICQRSTGWAIAEAA
jgi:DNA-binding IclR family transcriptional regulator